MLLRVVSYYRKKRFEKKKIAVKLEMSVYCFMLDMRLVMKTTFSVTRLAAVLAALVVAFFAGRAAVGGRCQNPIVICKEI